MLFTDKHFAFSDFPQKKIFCSRKWWWTGASPPLQPNVYSPVTRYLVYDGQKTASNNLEGRILCTDSSGQCQLQSWH